MLEFFHNSKHFLLGRNTNSNSIQSQVPCICDRYWKNMFLAISSFPSVILNMPIPGIKIKHERYHLTYWKPAFACAKSGWLWRKCWVAPVPHFITPMTMNFGRRGSFISGWIMCSTYWIFIQLQKIQVTTIIRIPTKFIETWIREIFGTHKSNMYHFRMLFRIWMWTDCRTSSWLKMINSRFLSVGVSVELFSITVQNRSEPKLRILKQRRNRNHFAIRKINRNKQPQLECDKQFLQLNSMLINSNLILISQIAKFSSF